MLAKYFPMPFPPFICNNDCCALSLSLTLTHSLTHERERECVCVYGVVSKARRTLWSISLCIFQMAHGTARLALPSLIYIFYYFRLFAVLENVFLFSGRYCPSTSSFLFFLPLSFSPSYNCNGWLGRQTPTYLLTYLSEFSSLFSPFAWLRFRSNFLTSVFICLTWCNCHGWLEV